MATFIARSISPRGQLIGGGVGSLPEMKRCHCMSSLSCCNYISSRVYEQRTSVGVSSSSKRSQRGATKSQLSQDEASSNSNTRVFKSMQDATERKEAEAIVSFDSADIARAIADAELLAIATSRGGKANQPPRFATLRAFGAAGGQGVVTTGFQGTSVFELIAANIEASKQVKNWEVLSGRLAMLAISVALGVELITGNSVFEGIDMQKLEAAAALCAFATLSAGGFAFAWRAKSDIVGLMATGYKNTVESAVDSIIDGLFFDEA